MSTKLITKQPCIELILTSILEKPTTFMKLVSESGCASENVEKYVSHHIEHNNVRQKKVNLEYYTLPN